MGDFMRQYWLPAVMSRALIADGDPLRLMLLGERLVAFRDSAGRVGVMDHRCPHRRAHRARGVYLGTGAEPPPLPLVEAKLVPDAEIWCLQRDCNWLQALEGDFDTSHVGLLHLGPSDRMIARGIGAAIVRERLLSEWGRIVNVTSLAGQKGGTVASAA